jgi:hypothetical protein
MFPARSELNCISRCGRNNSHLSKNHSGLPHAGSGVWSILLGRYIIKFSVVAMPWSGEHRGFVVAAF